MLPSSFPSVFDRCTAGTAHYLGVLASFTAEKEHVYYTPLLGFSPMGVESSLDADEHVPFFTYLFELFKHTFENVVCVIGDNCNTNKTITNKTSVPVIGWASHRFNLSAQSFLEKHEGLLAKVNALMLQLKMLLLGAKLMKLTGLGERARNQIRSGSTYDMQLRCRELKEHLHLLNSPDVDAFSMNTTEDRRINDLLVHFKNLKRMTKRLQKDNKPMEKVRALLDCKIVEFPESTNRLSANATILHSPMFESEIIKGQPGNAYTLTHKECLAISHFALSSHQFVEDAATLSHDKLLKWQKSSDQSDWENSDLHFLIPKTSGFASVYI